MSGVAVWLAILACLASPFAVADDSLPCLMTRTGWIRQLEAGDLKSAAASLGNIARHCPEDLRQPIGQRVPRFIDELRGPGLRESRLATLEALFDGDYQFKNGEEPSAWWRELVQHRLERSDTEGAKRFLERIDSFESLLGMRVDRRFDELTQAQPEKFDITAAQARFVRRLRARAESAPASLEARCSLASGLRTVGRPSEAIALMDSAIAAGEMLFDDWDEQYPWALTMLGFSLQSVHRYEEALVVLSRADELTQSGGDRASFVINLALVQMHLGRADEALTTLRRLGKTSDFGALLAAYVTHGAYVLKGDRVRADQALARVRERSHAEPSIYLTALLRHGKLGEARNELLERLRDPDRRTGALIDVQDYRDNPVLPTQREVRARMQQLLAMPDVNELIQEVGRIESFDFPPP